MRRRVMFNGRADRYVFTCNTESITTDYQAKQLFLSINSTKNDVAQRWWVVSTQNVTADEWDNNLLLVEWSDNNTTSTITGSIILQQAESDLQIIIPFSQGSASYNFSVASSSISATENNGSTSIAVTSTLGNAPVDWDITSYTDVIEVTKDGNNLVVSWGNNNKSESLSADITIHQEESGESLYISFTQSASTFPLNEARSFDYTGSVQSSALPAGRYKLQVWGAQGGSGGKGGYSVGVLSLAEPKTVYVFVGGKGSSSGNGGWNGGGGGSGSSSYTSGGVYGYSTMCCGGGATDIALVSSDMTYSSYRTNRSSESLLSRMIVAGGGSGYAYTYREESTTNESYETVYSGTMIAHEGPNSKGNYYGYKTVNLEYGSTYRLTYSSEGTLTEYGAFVMIKQNVSPWKDIKFFANSTNASRTLTFTVSQELKSDQDYRVGFLNVDQNVSMTCTLKKVTTTTSTSTSSDYSPGYAGGGTNGAGYSSSYYGKQNSAGSNGGFGYGANMTTTNYRHCSACGGGGWYGGGSAYSDSSITYVRYSGGGSGFVNTSANSSYRPSGYTGLELESGATYAGNTSFESTSGGTETGHSGNGYAKITRLKEAGDNSLASGETLEFEYTGSVQQTSLPAGEYKLECWGAQGGYRSSTSYGGKGGYSVGTIQLQDNTTLFVYVGGAGNTGGTSGGFNGGGKRYSYSGGGGASDIRIGTDSLYARVIVAGGGGSDGDTSKGGGAGGGATAQDTTASNFGTGGYGGTQTGNSGGSSYNTTSQSSSTTSSSDTYSGFGFGGNGVYRSDGYGGAGGGGWYGGVGTYPDGSGDDDKGGGGGSGYIYTSSTSSNYPSGCLLNSSHYLSDAQTIIGTSSFVSTSGGTETGHSGNGYVRITKI